MEHLPQASKALAVKLMTVSTVPTVIPPDPYSTHTPAREQGNQYALRALRERRAFMTGEPLKLEERRRFLKASITSPRHRLRKPPPIL